MKEVIISGSIFALFAFLCFLTIKTTDKITSDLSTLAEECEVHINAGEWGKANDCIKKAREVFVKKTYVLESYLLHEDIERLSDTLTNIEAAVEIREKRQAISAIRIFTRRLFELSESDKLTVNNIL